MHCQSAIVNPSPPGHRRTVTRNQISYQLSPFPVASCQFFYCLEWWRLVLLSCQGVLVKLIERAHYELKTI